MADFQLDIPHQHDKLLDGGLGFMGGAGIQQQHQVNIGFRVQLAATIAANGQQGNGLVLVLKAEFKHIVQQLVDKAGAATHQIQGIRIILECLIEGLIAIGNGFFKHRQHIIGLAGQRLFKGICVKNTVIGNNQAHGQFQL